MSNANADLKQRLVVGQHLEPSSSQEEQNTYSTRRRMSLLIIVKSFCFGAYVGLLLHVVTFSAFLVLIHWGKDPPAIAPFLLSSWFLCLLKYIVIAFYAILWVSFAMTLTPKGCMYTLKSFDNEADAPNSESVWTPQFLFLSANGFFLGGIVPGSYAAWTIVYIELGIPAPPTLVFSILPVDVGLCCLLIKCFDWYIMNSALQMMSQKRIKETLSPFK